jgi:UDP-glucuronate 4-epimerase
MSIFRFFKNILNNKKIDVYNYGKHKRSFTYIDDIIFNINKIILSLKKNLKVKDSKVYNIGNPQSISLLRLIKVIENIVKKNAKKNFMPFQTGDVLKTKANISKDENKLGFRFKVNIDQGVRKFSKWFLNEK